MAGSSTAGSRPLTIQEYVDHAEVTPKDVMAMAREHGVRMVDFKFTDLPGTWQHIALSINGMDEAVFEEGLGFDGSSIRGFQEIAASDMIFIPDPSTAVIDPFHEHRTISLTCNIFDPITREPYSRDPRFIAQKAEGYLLETGIADTCYVGPEAEFFVFDHVAYDQRVNTAFYEVDTHQGFWNRGAGFGAKNGERGNLGYTLRAQEGYFPAPPADTHSDLRARMVVVLEEMGISCEFHHHEVSSGGQAEIDLRYQPLLRMADQMQTYKYIVKNVAYQAGKSATFMPKPLFEENGSGMHVHQSLFLAGENVMYDFNGYGLMSREALNYIGGIIRHGRALMAFCAPTTNSYRRLTPGYEAPVNLCYSQRNRSAAVRIPVYSAAPKAKRIEFRPPDPTANPYLAFSALMMAGLDGIQNRIDPGDPVDGDLFEMSPEELAKIASVPASLEDALDALEADHEFLLKGGVFTDDLIETWIAYKRREECDAIRLRPHPWEFALYYDV
ncbi:MAG: glutamine synthetase [Solirubrobacterales bacterium]|jgi:glutamine synthetase|nr:glutamine synthetase [Solirubrobacterales bacterium]